MDYLLKASAILFIFYLFYKIVLHRETFFQSNRIFLLVGIIASLILPLVVIPIYVEQTISPIHNFTISQVSSISEIPKTINWTQIISLIYLVGVAIFGIKFLLSITSLCKLLITSKKEKIGDFYFIKLENNDSPFSFFNYIVYNPKAFEHRELEQVLVHEKVHAYQWHSFDVLFSQIVTILFWFNPISWLYKITLQQNLEFIADAISQEKSSCEKSYQHLLLKKSTAPNQFTLTNNFYNSLIKKRIIMLHKNRSKNTNHWKFAFILPLLTAFIFTFNTKTIAQTTVKKVNTKDNNRGLILDEIHEDIQMGIITKDSKQSDLDNIKKSFTTEGVKVKFKGIKRNKSNEITAIKIDVSSKQSNANFNTNSDSPINPIKISFDNEGGNISIGNGEIHHGDGDMFFVSKNGNHKVHTSGKGNQNFVFVSNDGKHEEHEIIEIKSNEDNVFVIKNGGEIHESKHDGEHKVIDIKTHDENDKVVWVTEDGNKTVEVIKDEDDDILYMIDGKEASKEELEKLDPNMIEKMEVLKGDKATKKYGTKVKDGVILITTKKE